MIEKLLIANRGEIVVRIIRACREMGISTVAVYSEADSHALHVAQADEAVLIGPAPAFQSYLRSDHILEAARRTNADAIHPGYGFLSESADFAESCASAGLTFVGPPADAIRLLGDKIRAKQLMKSAGIPLVPGYSEDGQSDTQLTSEADRIGFPLLIKASSGGGGRGMRLARNADSFAGELNEARREAAAAFGDDRVLLERFIDRARHIEFQIFGDTRGGMVHLFERECSIQRRHQKIIEESPSPILTPELRERMAAAAVQAGVAARYVNAGTVEFLFEERPDGDHQFYFLEVNTRLQVEHPVTEAITGIDIIKLQIRVASGEPIPFTQSEVRASGHALEARIYAESPASGFAPSIGTLVEWIPPAGPWVRIDSGVERGSEVTPYYDSMLAKLIVWGGNREESIARAGAALQSFHALGPDTNIAFLRDTIAHPAFRQGALSTRFIDEHMAAWQSARDVPADVLLALAAETLRGGADPTPSAGEQNGFAGFDPWRLTNGWRGTRVK